jgi:polysaccharide deacetylase 2 family uncharacterized protein YibQ
VAPDVARSTGETFAKGATVIDKIGTAMEVDRQLAALEATARGNGSAAGSGYASPVTVERVALWARGLEARGFELVPASAIVPPPKSP